MGFAPARTLSNHQLAFKLALLFALGMFILPFVCAVSPLLFDIGVGRFFNLEARGPGPAWDIKKHHSGRPAIV